MIITTFVTQYGSSAKGSGRRWSAEAGLQPTLYFFGQKYLGFETRFGMFEKSKAGTTKKYNLLMVKRL